MLTWIVPLVVDAVVPIVVFAPAATLGSWWVERSCCWSGTGFTDQPYLIQGPHTHQDTKDKPLVDRSGIGM